MGEATSSETLYESSSIDSVPHITDTEAEKIRDILRSVGRFSRRQQEISDSKIHPLERFEKHIIYGVTRGCIQRMRNNRRQTSYDPELQPKFLLFDALYEPTEEDRILKFVNPEVLVSRPELEKVIQNEHEVISHLDHPNIVKTHGLLKKGVMSYLILEYLPFRIKDIIGEKPELKGVAFFMSESAKALSYLHSQGVVHGDIKVEQFMGGYLPADHEYRVIKLLDFAGATHPDVPTPSRMMYTPLFAAPEITRSHDDPYVDPREVFTHRSDMYSLGLAYARVALGSVTGPEEVSAILNEEDKVAQRAVEAMNDNHLPYRLGFLVEDMTAERPEDRPNIEQVLPRVREFCMLTGMYNKIHMTRDLYSREILGIRVERAF